MNILPLLFFVKEREAEVFDEAAVHEHLLQQEAGLLVVADCIPFAYADFNPDLLNGKAVVVGCPKLDDPHYWWRKEGCSLIGEKMEMEGEKLGENWAGDVQIISVKLTSPFLVNFRSFSIALASI